MSEFKAKIDEFKDEKITEIILKIDNNERDQPEQIHYTEIKNLLALNFQERIKILTSSILYNNNWYIKIIQAPEVSLYSAFPFLEEKQFNNSYVVGGMLLNLSLGISTNGIDLDIAVSEPEHDNIPIMIQSIQQYYKDTYKDSISMVTSRTFPIGKNNSYVKRIIYINVYSNKVQSVEHITNLVPDILQEIQIILVEDVHKYVNDFDIPVSKIFTKLGSEPVTFINYSAGICLLINSFPINSKAFSKSTIRRVMKYFINKNMAILLPSSGHLPTMLYKLSKVRTEIGYKINSISIKLDKVKNIEAIISTNKDNSYEVQRNIINIGDSISSFETERILSQLRHNNFVTISNELGNSLTYLISIAFGSKLIEKHPWLNNQEILVDNNLNQFDLDLYKEYRNNKLRTRSNTLTRLSSLTPKLNLDELKNLFDLSFVKNMSLYKIYHNIQNNNEDIKDAELIVGYINRYCIKTQELWNVYFGNESDVKNKSSSFNRIDISEFLWEAFPDVIPPTNDNIRHEKILDYMLIKMNDMKQNNECCICLTICNTSNGNYASICGRHMYHLECYMSYRNSLKKNVVKIVCPCCRC